MRDASTVEGGLQRIGHVTLTDDVLECVWPITAVQCCAHN